MSDAEEVTYYFETADMWGTYGVVAGVLFGVIYAPTALALILEIFMKRELDKKRFAWDQIMMFLMDAVLAGGIAYVQMEYLKQIEQEYERESVFGAWIEYWADLYTWWMSENQTDLEAEDAPFMLKMKYFALNFVTEMAISTEVIGYGIW